MLLPLVLVFGAAAGPTQARSLQVTGATGYLSEWQVSGNVTETVSGRVRAFAGPLTMKHVGLCRQDGQEEKVAEIKFQLTKPTLLSQSRAIVIMDGAECTLSGKVSDADSGVMAYSGVMDCPTVKGVPLTLSIK
jgi:hypothetical protein